MRGNEVFKVAVNTLGRIVDETLEANQLEKSAVDWLVPHQANIRILAATAKKLNMSMDQVIVTLEGPRQYLIGIGTVGFRPRRA